MLQEKTQKETARENEVLITRIIDAPRELVFRLWTDPAHLQRWFAPKGCTVLFKEIDVRPGGGFFSCIKNPRFPDCWCKGVYLEVVAPERIVYTMMLADDQGNPVQAAAAGKDADWPGETTVTVTFAEAGAKTRLTLHQTVSESLAKHTGAYTGWLEMLDVLEEQLAGHQ